MALKKFGFTAFLFDHTAVAKTRQRYAEVAISIFDFGGSTLLFGGRTEHIRQRQMHLHWGAVPHQPVEHVDPSRFWVVIIPLAWFLSWELSPSFIGHVLSGGLVREPDPARAELDCALFALWETDLRNGSDAVRRSVVLEVRARVQRLAAAVEVVEGSGAGPVVAPVPDGQGEQLDRMLRLITERHAGPLTVDDIARAAEMHPNAAMRLFRRSWGISLWSFVTEYRVWQAQVLLATTDHNMLEVARRSGFGSAAQFYAASKKLMGVSPAAYRRSLRLEGNRKS